MVEKLEQIIVKDFSQGYDVCQFPPTYVRPRTMGNRLVHLLGVDAQKDGTLAWHRNQFYIDGVTGITPNVLFEYVTDNYNQFLILGTDGKLYVDDFNWITNTPVQWTYGYELFSTLTPAGWVPEKEAGLKKSGPWAVEQVRDNVLFGHKDENTKRWNGVDLVDIGMQPPSLPLAIESGIIDFDPAFTETDAGGYLLISGVGDKTVTATLLPNNSDSRMSMDYGTGNPYNWTCEFDCKLTAASADGSRAIIVGWSNTDDETEANWVGSYVSVCFKRVGSDYYIGVEADFDSDYIEIALGTEYHVVFTVVNLGFFGTKLSVVVTDAGAAVGTAGVSYGVGVRTYQYMYATTSIEDANAFTTSFYVTDVYLGAALGAGDLPTGTYSYYYTWYNEDEDWESMPSPILDVVNEADDKEIVLSNILVGPTGTTARILYRAMTISIVTGARGSEFQRLDTIADNTTTTYTDNAPQAYLGDIIPFDYARPPRGDILCGHKDHVFMAGTSRTSDSYSGYETDTEHLGNMLFYSKLGYYQYWPGDNYIEVGDDAPIVGLASYRDFLLIFKTNSVFTLAGSEGSFVLRQIDSQWGATDPCSVASSPQGVVWTTPQGIVFYDGQSARIIYEVDMKTPFIMSKNEFPWLAWHQGYVYFMATEQATETKSSALLRWDSARDLWEMYPHTQDSAVVGIRSFNWGKFQSHILAWVNWHDAVQEIAVIDPAMAFANGSGEGTSRTAYRDKIAITLPPLIADPGEEICVHEIWIDGYWVHDADYPIKLYLNNNASYTDGDLGTAPQLGRGAMVPTYHVADDASLIDRVHYIQIAGDHAVDFYLRSVRVVYARRKRRATAS